MKRYICAGLIALLFLGTVEYGYSFLLQDWYYVGTGAGGSPLYDSAGNDVSAIANWQFQLICDPNGDTSVAGMIADNQGSVGAGTGNGAADDVVIGSPSYWNATDQYVAGWDLGVVTDIPEIYGAKKFYIRFFDSDGCHVGLIYNTGNAWVLPATPVTPPTAAWADPILAAENGQNVAGSRHVAHSGPTDGFAAVIPLALPLAGYGQMANDGFNPGANDIVRAFAVDANGRILVGGDFTNLAGQACSYLGRLNANGTPDPSFTNGTGGPVYALAMQTDGHALVGGLFTNVGSVARSCLVRLDVNGAVDGTFDPAPNGPVHAIAVQSDGKILVGGGFSSLAGQPCNRLGRLLPDGTLDLTFSNEANDTVRALVVTSDNSILVAGDFTILGGQPRSHLARILSSDGGLDLAFTNGIGAGTVYALAVQPDSSILVGGNFSNLAFNSHQNLGRLLPSGAHDASFVRNVNGPVLALAVQPDGKILVGGTFANPRSHLARLKPDGSLDTLLYQGADNDVYALLYQPDNNVLVGGGFTNLEGQARSRLGRLTQSCSVDTPLNILLDGGVKALAIQPDGGIILGGAFTNAGGTLRCSLARIDPNASVDVVFYGHASNGVQALAIQPDEQIVVGGSFTSLAAQAQYRIGRLYSNGFSDITFGASAMSNVNCLVIQNDGKIVIGGMFTNVNGQARMRLARLNPDGTLDLSFNPPVSGPVFALALQPDGRIVVGGQFISIGGQPRNNIGRLNGDGSVDLSFTSNGTDQVVYSLALDAFNKILVGGNFANIAGQPHAHLARLNSDGSFDFSFVGSADSNVQAIAVQTDGRILVGGAFTNLNGQFRSRLGRFNPDGSLDFSFVSDANGPVSVIAPQADGKVLVGGAFSMLAGQARSFLGRLALPEMAYQQLAVDPAGVDVTWIRQGAGPEVGRVVFEYSSNAVTWNVLGQGTRLTNGWRLAGLNLPIQQTFLVRARGFATGRAGNGSGALVESVRMIYLHPSGPPPPEPVWFRVYGIPSPLFTNQWASVTVEAMQGTSRWVNYTGTVVFSSHDLGAVLPTNQAFSPSDAGLRVFTNAVAFAGHGDYPDIEVLDATNSMMRGLQSGIVVFGGYGVTPDRLMLWGIADPCLTNEWSSFSLAAVDADFNLVNTYTGRVEFNCSDPFVWLLPDGLGGSNYTFRLSDTGWRTFTNDLRFRTIGEHWITATDANNSNLWTEQRGISVQGAGVSTTITHLVIGQIPSRVSTNRSYAVGIEVRNDLNQVVQDYVGDVVLTLSDPAATYPSLLSFTLGDHGGLWQDNALQFGTPGPQTIEARLVDNTNIYGRYDVQIDSVPSLAIVNLAPSGITAGTATLNGQLVSTGARTNAMVRLYCGLTDGGVDPAAWSNVINLGVRSTGAFSTNIPGLRPATTYYYRGFASNASGTAWAPDTATFATLPITNSLTVFAPLGNPDPPTGVTWFVQGTPVTASVAGSPVLGIGTQFVCAGWTGIGSVPSPGNTTSVTFNITTNTTISWAWRPQFQLSAVAGPNGSVFFTNGWYNAGTLATLQAVPNTGYHFANWTGTLISVTNPLNLVMNRAHTLVANFTPDLGGVSVSIQPATVAPAAAWRLTRGADTNWHASGETVSNLLVGTYAITFLPVPDWTRPADQTNVVVRNGWITTRVVRYVAGAMVLIPGGAFQMGIYNGAGGHPVTLSTYYLDAREVTVGEYRTFCTNTGRFFPIQPWGTGNSRRPVVNVNWQDATDYATWVGKRLPTEAEWEYAARGFLNNALYPWGDSISPASANYGNPAGSPASVGSYPANGAGLSDMAGNVAEWCRDWYTNVLPGSAVNPSGPANGTYRVLRGGSYASSPVYLQCAMRFYNLPTVQYRDIGFRCATAALPGETGARPMDTNTPPVMTSIALNPDGAGFIIQWQSQAERFYILERLTSLVEGFVPLSAHIPATPPLNIYTDATVSDSGPCLYRVKVE